MESLTRVMYAISLMQNIEQIHVKTVISKHTSLNVLSKFRDSNQIG